MFAVIKTGGKQYKVSENDYLQVEKLDLEVGNKIELPALMYVNGTDTIIGTPMVEGVTVKCEVLQIGRAHV